MARRSVVRSVRRTEGRRGAKASQPSESDESCVGFLRESDCASGNQVSERVTAMAVPRIRPGRCALSGLRPGGFVGLKVVSNQQAAVAIRENVVGAEFAGPLECSVPEV